MAQWSCICPWVDAPSSDWRLFVLTVLWVSSCVIAPSARRAVSPTNYKSVLIVRRWFPIDRTKKRGGLNRVGLSLILQEIITCN